MTGITRVYTIHSFIVGINVFIIERGPIIYIYPSLPSSVPSSSSPAFSLPFSSSASTFSSLAPSAPLPPFTLPSVVPSVLFLSSSSSVPSFRLQQLTHPFYASAAPPSSPDPLPSFSAPPLSSVPVHPPPGFSALPSLPQAPLLLLRLRLSPLRPPLLLSLLGGGGGGPPGFLPVSALSSSSLSSSSSTVGDLADFQARILGLSAYYHGFGRWFVASGDSDFRSYLAAHCPHLYSDFRADFASGSSRFLAALSSSASLPLPPSSAAPAVSSLSFPSQPPVAPVPLSSSLAPSAPPFRFPAPLLPSLSSSAPSALPQVFRTPQVSSSASLSLSDWHAVQGGAALAPGLGAVPVSLSVPPPALAPSLFCPFTADPAPSVPVPAAPLPSALPSAPGVFPGPSSSSAPPPFLAATSSSFVAPEDAGPEALPWDADSAVLESFRSEFRRMLSFLVDLFPQAVGTPSAPPPPRALFEDFFGSSVPSSSPIFLLWFERVRTALSDADARLSSFLSSGCSDFLFLPQRNSSYAVG